MLAGSRDYQVYPLSLSLIFGPEDPRHKAFVTVMVPVLGQPRVEVSHLGRT